MSLPILLEEVRCIPENILCELYVVKVWEGMVQNSLICHTFPITEICPSRRVGHFKAPC